MPTLKLQVAPFMPSTPMFTTHAPSDHITCTIHLTPCSIHHAHLHLHPSPHWHPLCPHPLHRLHSHPCHSHLQHLHHSCHPHAHHLHPCRHVFHPTLHPQPLTQPQHHQLISPLPHKWMNDKTNTYPLTHTSTHIPHPPLQDTHPNLPHVRWMMPLAPSTAPLGPSMPTLALRPCVRTASPPQSTLAPLAATPLAPSTFTPLPFAPAASMPFAPDAVTVGEYYGIGWAVLVWGVAWRTPRRPWIHSQGVRGQFVATTSEEETACRRQPGLRHGCRVHAALSADAEAAVVGGKRSGSLGVGGPRP